MVTNDNNSPRMEVKERRGTDEEKSETGETDKIKRRGKKMRKRR
jgi:hypothetical protein